MTWQVQEAKQRFSELIRRAVAEGPQVVTRRGEAIAVVVSAEEYRRLHGERLDFKEFLLSGPDLGDIEMERAVDLTREVDLSDGVR